MCGGPLRRLLCLAASTDGGAVAASGAARMSLPLTQQAIARCCALCRHAWQMLLTTPSGPRAHLPTTLSSKAVCGRASRLCPIGVSESKQYDNNQRVSSLDRRRWPLHLQVMQQCWMCLLQGAAKCMGAGTRCLSRRRQPQAARWYSAWEKSQSNCQTANRANGLQYMSGACCRAANLVQA